jgi:hypothetical protein
MVTCVKGNNRTNRHIMPSRNAYYNLMLIYVIRGFVLFVWHVQMSQIMAPPHYALDIGGSPSMNRGALGWFFCCLNYSVKVIQHCIILSHKIQ